MTAATDTVPARLLLRANQTPTQPAYWRRGPQGKWHPVTWDGVAGRVNNLAGQLHRLGLRGGDRVAIMLPTVPEWEYCQLAAHSLGGVVVGLDAHDTPENLRHILRTVAPVALIAADAAQLELLTTACPSAPAVSISLEPSPSASVHCLRDLLAQPAAPASNWPAVSPERDATIVFTSGSTGQPKGIAYTHRQLCLAGEAIVARYPGIDGDSRLACWLPLSNLFQRIINLCAILRGAQSYFVDDPREIAQRLLEIRPALFIGVPRFYEKLYAGIRAEVAKRPAAIGKLVEWAWDIGTRYQAAQRRGVPPGLLLSAAYPLANRFVLGRLRAVMGSDIRFMVSGSAPMPAWLLEKLHGLGWLVLEAYGISECVIPIASDTPSAYRFGSVGRPLPENRIRLADDGEVLVRGEGVFRGYCGATGDESPLDGEGYLHTGDLGRLDEDGFLWLTGRKSEIFKTSTGRRVAPVPVESCLKQLAYVEQAVLFGRNRPVPVALLCLDMAALSGQGTDQALTSEQLEAIGRDLTTACEALPASQRPAGALVTRRGLSIATGELTSNLKLRRATIETRFGEHLDALYDALARSVERTRTLVLEAP